jgi:hypothetical protein
MKHFLQTTTTAGRTAEILLALCIIVGAAIPLQTRVAAFVYAVYFAVYVVFLRWCKRRLAARTATAPQVTLYFMWWTVAKLFVSIVILFIYIKLGANIREFLAAFAVLTIVFLLYEIFSVQELNDGNSRKQLMP